MSEIPFITLRSEDGEFILTPDNSRLFTFVGKTLLENGDYSENTDRNHVYYIGPDGEQGIYIFGKENVQSIGGAMLRNDFPADLNRRTVPPEDEAAYQRYLSQRPVTDEIPDELPEGWNG